MDKDSWTKPNLVSLTGASDSEGGQNYNIKIEDSNYSPSGVGFPN